jgi:predicted DNA-binding protein
MTKKKPSTSSKDRLLKKAISVYLEPEQAAELEALTARTRVPQQVYIREGVDAVLAKYRKK